MNAAESVRLYTARSTELHEEYLGDPVLLKQYERFIAWQLDYMLPQYRDFRAKPGYAAAVDFVVTDLTGIGVSKRDDDLARVLPTVIRMLPQKVLQSVATAMELNARVLAMNLAICRQLFDGQAADDPITERAYCEATRTSTTLANCLPLVLLTRQAGNDLKRVVHLPMIGVTLRAMRAPAHFAGFGALQEFLESGYATFTALPDVDRFLEDMENRMTEVFTGLYTKPLDSLSD